MLIRRNKPGGGGEGSTPLNNSQNPNQQNNASSSPPQLHAAASGNSNNTSSSSPAARLPPPPLSSSTMSNNSITKLPVPLPNQQLQQQTGGGVGGIQLPPQNMPQGLPPGRFVGAPPSQLPPGGKFVHPSQMPPSTIPPGKVIPLTGSGGTPSQHQPPPLPRNSTNPSQKSPSRTQHQHQQNQNQEQQHSVSPPPHRGSTTRRQSFVGGPPPHHQNHTDPNHHSNQRNHHDDYNSYSPQRAVVHAQEFRQAQPPPRPPRRIPQGTETLDLDTQPDDIKQLHKRLVNFFSHYSPYLVRQVDHLILQYADREEELWKSLETKYGSEPPFPDEGMDVRSRLIRFFRRYDPSYEGQVDKVLDTYAGHHDLMWKSLTNRFGPEPDIPSKMAKRREVPMDLASRLERFFKNNDPKRIVKIDELMISYKDRELDLRDMLKQLYDDELEAPNAQGWAKLEKEKKKREEEAERKKREEILASSRAPSFSALKKEEEEEEAGKSPSPQRPGSAGVSVLDRIEARKKLTNYLHHLSPDREPMMDDILDNFTGEEKQVVQTVERIFGPVDELEKKRRREEEERKLRAEQDAEMIKQQKSEMEKLEMQRIELEKKRKLEQEEVAKKMEEQEKQKMLEKEQQAALKARQEQEEAAKNKSVFVPDPAQKERLVRYYTRVAPGKLDTVDATLERYQGREAEMWAMLEEKYGPPDESGRSTPNKRYPPPPGVGHKQRLINFFNYYRKADGSQLSNIDESLERYKDKEEMMFNLLSDKYGPEPWIDDKNGNLIPNPYASIELQEAQREANRKDEEERERLEKEEKERQQQQQQQQQSTVTPASAPLDYRTRVFRFYSIHDETKANDEQINKVLTKYAEREEVLMEMLTDKYNCKEPTEAEWQIFVDKSNTQQQTPNSTKPAMTEQEFRERLMRFYKVYDPSKATEEQASRVLAKYEGAEETLFEMLVAKYGPEPLTPGAKADETLTPPPVTTTNSAASGQQQQQQQQQQTTNTTTSSMASGSHEERLFRFYQHYDPSKANPEQVQKVLAKYTGNEAELWDKLEAKFGPESAVPGQSQQQQQHHATTSLPSPDTTNTTTASGGNHAERLMKYYQYYEPSKANAAQIERVLTKYDGNEEQLWEMLEAKFGPESAVTTHNHNNNSATTATSTSNIEQQQQQQTSQIQQQQQSSTATANSGNHAERLMKFYQHYEPTKANPEQIQKVLAKYEGNEGQLWEMLEAKFGPESAVVGASASNNNTQSQSQSQLQQSASISNNNNNNTTTANASSSPPSGGNHAERLMKFYQHYEPTKANPEQIQKVLTKYSGNESQLWEMLEAKFGPESAVGTTTTTTPSSSQQHQQAPAAAANNNNNNNNNNTVSSSSASGGNHAERLMKFYQHYEPTKANQEQIQKVLAKYQGNEGQLWEMLEAKFGPESAIGAAAPTAAPTSTTNVQNNSNNNNNINNNPHRERLMNFYLKANETQITKILTKYQGDEETLFEMLEAKYVNQSQPPQQQQLQLSTADRIMAFYQKVDPAKATDEQVKKVTAKYEGQEQTLFEMLEAKYGQPV